MSFFCRKFEGPDKYFEKKLKAKKELMKSFETKEIDEWDLVEDDDLSGEEDKGPLFINELVRPVVSRSLR